MKIYTKLSALTACGMLIAHSANAATLINEYPDGNSSNISVTASTYDNQYGVPLVTLTTDRFSAEFDPGVHDNPSDGQHSNAVRQSWRSSSGALAADQWIQWDLGQSYQLDSIQLWNYNDGSRYASGIRQVDIWISNVVTPGDPEGAGAANWTLWAENAILDAAPGTTGYTGFDLATVVTNEIGALSSFSTRYIRFGVDSTFKTDGVSLGGGTLDGDEVVGLAQIEFYAVPEPSTTLLGGLGMLMLLLPRRRR